MIPYPVTTTLNLPHEIWMGTDDRGEKEKICLNLTSAEYSHQVPHSLFEAQLASWNDSWEVLLYVDGDEEPLHGDPFVTSVRHRSATRAQEKSRLISSRAAAPSLDLRSRSSSIVISATATDPTSGAERNPVTLCLITSAIPPTAVASTGDPTAIAFRRDMGRPSWNEICA